MPSFRTKRETIQADPKAKKKLDNLSGKIKMALSILSNAEKAAAGVKSRESEIKALEADIKSLKSEESKVKKNLVKMNADFEKTRDVCSADLDELVKRLESRSSEEAMAIDAFEKLEEMKKSQNIALQGIEIDIASKEGKRKELERDYNSIKKEVDKEIDDKKKELSLVSKDLKDKRAVNDELKAKETELEAINFYLKDAVSEKIKLANELGPLQKSIDTANSSLESTKANLAEISAKIKSDAKQQIKILEEREGDVSNKEKWLEEKEEKLRGVKKDLEKHYGKPLKHIVI